MPIKIQPAKPKRIVAAVIGGISVRTCSAVAKDPPKTKEQITSLHTYDLFCSFSLSFDANRFKSLNLFTC